MTDISKIKSLLADWRSHLLELFIAALTVCSGLTTFIGARNLVNDSWLVAALFTAGIQGSMYVVAYYATTKKKGTRRTLSLYFAWMLLAIFSVYSSALGMFELQLASLRNDHQRASLTAEWRAAVDHISSFRAQALAIVRAKARETSLLLTFERNRERSARRSRLPYSPRERQTLNARLAALTETERRFAAMRPLASAPPDRIPDATAALDAAFAQAADLHSALPDDCRAQAPLPRRSFGQTIPEDLQKAFWMELQSRSAPALLITLIAFLLDFLPIAVRYACRERRSLAQVIRDLRLASKKVWSALSLPLEREHVIVRIEVYDFDEIESQATFAAEGAGPYLADLKRLFEAVERAVSDVSGKRMEVVEARTSSNERILPDSPLLAQLESDLTVRLRVEPAGA
ncbi:MAG: hypothetical protein AB1631_32850 [Acidobacteriota bacterium]